MTNLTLLIGGGVVILILKPLALTVFVWPRPNMYKKQISGKI